MSLERKYIKNQPLRACSHAESGSAIIIIFVTIALFAALTYVFSSGTRSGASQITGEQAKLAASEILDYGAKMKRAVQQMQINGCTTDEIDFANTIYKADDGTDNYPETRNTLSPADFSCHVFHPNGGNLVPQIFANDEATPSGAALKSGHVTIAARDILGVGIDGQNELVFYLIGIQEKTCLQINELLNIENPAGAPPIETSYTPIGDEATVLVGKKSFCFFRDTSPTNKRHVFIHTLIEQ